MEQFIIFYGNMLLTTNFLQLKSILIKIS